MERYFKQIFFFGCLVFAFPTSGQTEGANLLQAHGLPKRSDIFQRGTFDVGFALGAGPGMTVLGSDNAHDLALGKLHFGWVFTDVVAEDRWYGGNWELIGEAFGGWQFSPETDYLAGIMPVLRYNFTTGNRLVPFMDAGAGSVWTDIDAPDLDGRWQFGLSAGAGVHWFFLNDLALTFSYRFLHLSNGGSSSPNHGVNTSLFNLGLSWFF